MKGPERAERDAKALAMFVAGYTYKQIGEVIGLKSYNGVGAIIKRELAAAAQRRALLSDEAFSIYQERTERLFNAYWAPALRGDIKAAAICGKLLQQEARLYGIDSTVSAPVDVDFDDTDEELDELARLRAQRSGT